MNKTLRHEDWSIQTMMWYAVLIWFSASLLSQSLYLAFNREPYDAVELLRTLGPIYYLIFFIEIVMWVTLIFLGYSKVKSLKSKKTTALGNSTVV